MPLYINPAEFLLDLTSSDFAQGEENAALRVEKLHSDWIKSAEAKSLNSTILTIASEKGGSGRLMNQKTGSSFVNVVLTLLHRSFIKSYRDVVAYGIRFAMYIGQYSIQYIILRLTIAGLAIMMGTVWLRLPPIQSSIQPFINAIVRSTNNCWPKCSRYIVFWLSIHVFHGRCLRPRFPRRPSHVHQRAS